MTGRLTVIVSLLCLVLLLLFAFATEVAEQSRALVKCFVVLPVFLLLPGFVFYKARARSLLLPAALLPGVFFSFSVMLYLPLTLLAYAFRMSTTIYVWLALVLAICAVAIAAAGMKHGRGERHGACVSHRDLLFFCIVFALATLVSAVALAKGTFIFRGDLWLHMSIVKKFFTRGIISPESPIFATGGFDANYSYALWHPVLAVLGYFSRLDVQNLWFNMPPVLTIVALLTWYGFALYLLHNHVAALIALLLALYDMLFGDLFFQGIITMQYPYSVAPLIVLPVVWVFIMEYLRTGRWALGVGAVLGYVALIFLHKLTVLGFILHIGFFLGCLVIVSPQRKLVLGKVIRLIAALMAVSIIYAAGFPSGKVVNPLHRAFAEDEVKRWSKGLVIVKPEVALTRAGIIVSHKQFSVAPAIAVLCFPYVVWRLLRRRAWVERRPAALFLVSGMLILPFVMFNPIAGGIIAEKFSSQTLVRLYHALPYYLIIGFVVSDAYRSAVRYVRKARWYPSQRTVTIACAALAILAAVIVSYPKVAKALAAGKNSYYHMSKDTLSLCGLLKEIDEDEAQPQVILADYASSYFITALTKHYVTMMLPTQTSPSMADYHEHNGDVMQFFGGRDTRRAERIIQKYDARYVVVGDGRECPGIEPYLDRVTVSGKALKKIAGGPDVLAYRVVRD